MNKKKFNIQSCVYQVSKKNEEKGNCEYSMISSNEKF